MSSKTIFSFVLLAFFTCGFANAQSVTWFEEDFNVDSANWKNRLSFDPTYNSTGGSDGGGYISTTYSFSDPAGSGALLFRAQDEFVASGNAFVGNWVDENITEVTFNIRHNAPVPVVFGSRFSGPGNFPGGSAFNFAPVLPNVWTEVSLIIDESSPQFVTFEGTSFATVFANIGHIQISPSTPTGFDNDPTVYTFDLDEVIVTAAIPEPATTSLIGLALAASAFFGRRNENEEV